MKMHGRRFQICPLWRAFSNLCVYGERFHRLRVEGRPKRIKKFAFTGVCVYNRLRVDGALVYFFFRERQAVFDSPTENPKANKGATRTGKVLAAGTYKMPKQRLNFKVEVEGFYATFLLELLRMTKVS